MHTNSNFQNCHFSWSSLHQSSSVIIEGTNFTCSIQLFLNLHDILDIYVNFGTEWSATRSLANKCQSIINQLVFGLCSISCQFKQNHILSWKQKRKFKTMPWLAKFKLKFRPMLPYKVRLMYLQNNNLGKRVSCINHAC